MTIQRLVLACGLAWLAAGGLAGAGASPQAQPSGAPGFIGSEACLTCHEGADRGYVGSAHARAVNPRTPAAKHGCESCHGPGQAHADDPGEHPLLQFDRAPAREASAACMTCHNRGDHAFFEGSAHDARNLSCASCHSVHQPKSARAQLKTATPTATCAQCHRDKIAKLDRSGHMPVREGKMECSTCHNPHGSMNVRLLRAGHSIGEACASCHTDKRGPFLWEHAPVRESCATCHDPHGSSNERMLVAKPPILCQRCHAHTRHPSTIYDGAVITTSNRLYGRSCVTCHANIHGSNHASGATFLR